MGNDNSSLKELFNKLDKNHEGQLKLSDVLTLVAPPGFNHAIHNSPLLLYRFDEQHEGNLDYQEFVKLLTHLRHTEKRLKKRKRTTGSDKKVWCSVKRETSSSEFCLDRDAETPAFCSVGKNHSKSSSDSDSSDSDSYDDQELEHDLDEELRHDAQQYFDENIHSTNGKKSFISWLFKMADTDSISTLSENELVPLLQALRKDGISPECLVYDADKCKHDDARLAREIMKEYDTGRLGYLTQHEFEIIGDLIVKNYELRAQYESGSEVADFVLKRRLGKGAAGEVRLAVHKNTHDKKAIKIIPKGDVADCTKLDTEIKAMLMLQHPHIVQLEQVLESEGHVFFVMELCGGGNLHEYLDAQPISEDLAKYYFHQIIDGICYCHAKGVAHRDLSLANLLLDNEANIKISDFGCAGIFVGGWDLFATPMVGGLQHIAPEQICGSAYSGEKMDMWAAGIILYTLLVGRNPFKAAVPQQYLDDIKNIRFSVPENISSEAADLIKSLLVYDPQQRLSCPEVMKHPWMQGDCLASPQLSLRTFLVPIDHAGLFKDITKGKQRRKLASRILKTIGIYILPPVDVLCKSVEEKCKVRCSFPEKDLKFCFCLKKSIKAGQYVIEFTLREGESRDLLSLMPKVKNALQKATRRTGKSKPSISDSFSSSAMPRTQSVDSLASDSPDELEVLDWSDSFDDDLEKKDDDSVKKEEKLERTPKDKKGHRRSRSTASNSSAPGTTTLTAAPDPLDAVMSELKKSHHRSDSQRQKKHKNKEKKKQRDEKRDEKRATHLV